MELLPPHKLKLDEGVSLSIASTMEEIEALRPFWEKWQNHPNVDIDYYKRTVEIKRETCQPCVIVLSINTDPVAMLVGRIENVPLVVKLGYLKILTIKQVALTVIYGGAIGDFSEKNCESMLQGVFWLLKEKRFEIFLCHYLGCDTPFFKILKTKPRYLCRDHALTPNIHWRMNLPDSFETITSKLKRKHKYWLRRLAGKLETAAEGDVDFRCIDKIDNMDLICGALESIAKNTYHRGLGVGFIDNDEYRNRLSFLSEQGRLIIYILYVRKKPAAYWLATRYQETIYLNTTGYDPEFEQFEVGTYVFMKMLEDLCTKKIAKQVDFGLGDAFYKQRFGDNFWHESSVSVYPVSVKGITTKLLLVLSRKVSSAIVCISEKSKIKDKLKKIWRKKAKTLS